MCVFLLRYMAGEQNSKNPQNDKIPLAPLTHAKLNRLGCGQLYNYITVTPTPGDRNFLILHFFCFPHPPTCDYLLLVMESDSSDDEDFVLTSAMEKEAYSEEKTSTKTKKEGMFGDLIEQKRKAKVDSLWQEMNSVGAPTSVPGKKKGGKKAAKKSQKNVKRAKEMMGDIFGKKVRVLFFFH